MWKQLCAVAYLIVAGAIVVFAITIAIHYLVGAYPHRMSTRPRVFVWIVIAVAVAVWIAAVWFVIFQPGPLTFLPFKLN